MISELANLGDAPDASTIEKARAIIRRHLGTDSVQIIDQHSSEVSGLRRIAVQTGDDAHFEMLASAAEVIALVMERNRARTVLVRDTNEFREFTYAVSHELREPLRTISAYTQLLRNRYGTVVGEDGGEFLSYVVDATARMDCLFWAIAAYSRAGTASDRADTGMEIALQCALDNLAKTIGETGASVSHEPLPSVYASQSEMIQLLEELIGNAIKYRGNEAPRIHISAERSSDQTEHFRVCDNGIGIAPGFADRIFGAFKRLHGREYPGSGIGLAICRKIVERHGGHIWVESQPGAGSTFYFSISGTASGSTNPDASLRTIAV